MSHLPRNPIHIGAWDISFQSVMAKRCVVWFATVKATILKATILKATILKATILKATILMATILKATILKATILKASIVCCTLAHFEDKVVRFVLYLVYPSLFFSAHISMTWTSSNHRFETDR